MPPMMKGALLIAMTLLLGGCTYIGSIKMKNKTTGETVQCGAYFVLWGNGGLAQNSMNRCLDDYKQQGYVRIPD